MPSGQPPPPHGAAAQYLRRDPQPALIPICKSMLSMDMVPVDLMVHPVGTIPSRYRRGSLTDQLINAVGSTLSSHLDSIQNPLVFGDVRHSAGPFSTICCQSILHVCTHRDVFTSPHQAREQTFHRLFERIVETALDGKARSLALPLISFQDDNDPTEDVVSNLQALLEVLELRHNCHRLPECNIKEVYVCIPDQNLCHYVSQVLASLSQKETGAGRSDPSPPTPPPAAQPTWSEPHGMHEQPQHQPTYPTTSTHTNGFSGGGGMAGFSNIKDDLHTQGEINNSLEQPLRPTQHPQGHSTCEVVGFEDPSEEGTPPAPSAPGIVSTTALLLPPSSTSEQQQPSAVSTPPTQVPIEMPAAPTPPQQPRAPRPPPPANFFTNAFGFEEVDYNTTRATLMSLARPSSSGATEFHLPDGNVLDAGSFTMPSVQELRDIATRQAAQLQAGHNGGGSTRITFTNVVADIADVHRRGECENATVQVASQTNCLEFRSSQQLPEHGISCYEQDYTQGPACVRCTAAGTAFRNYMVSVAHQESGSIISEGQTVTAQLNILDGLIKEVEKTCAPPCFMCANGYLQVGTPEARKIMANVFHANDSTAKVERILERICVGVQNDTQITACTDGKARKVTHVLCSALPLLDPHGVRDRELIARLVLRGMYEATLLIACIAAGRAVTSGQPASMVAQRRRVYLTQLGAGEFGNDLSWVCDAVLGALQSVEKFGIPLDIIMVHYRQDTMPLFSSLSTTPAVNAAAFPTPRGMNMPYHNGTIGGHQPVDPAASLHQHNPAPQRTPTASVGGIVQVPHNTGHHMHAPPTPNVHSTNTSGIPPVSVMTVNVLHQAFYDKYCKNRDFFPLTERLRILQRFVKDHIIRQCVDVVFFQEYSAVDMSSITALLTKYGYDVEMPGDAAPNTGCAVAYLHSRFTFESSRAFPFDDIPLVPPQHHQPPPSTHCLYQRVTSSGPIHRGTRGGKAGGRSGHPPRPPRLPTGKEVTVVKLRLHGSSDDAIVFGSMHVPFAKTAPERSESLRRGLEGVLFHHAENRVILGGDFNCDILPPSAHGSPDGVGDYAQMMNLSVFSPPESTCLKSDSTFAKFDHFLARGFAPPPSSTNNSGFQLYPSSVSDLLPHSAHNLAPSTDRAFFSDHRAVLVHLQMV